MTARTLYDKHIDSHTVCHLDDQRHVLLYIGRQVINEYTSPQAFSGLREAGRAVWRPGTALAVVDRVNPTTPNRIAAMPDAGGARQVSYLAENCRDFGIELLDILDKRQGIEHLLASQTLVYKRLKTLRVTVDGALAAGLTSKDVIMALIGKIGACQGSALLKHILGTLANIRLSQMLLMGRQKLHMPERVLQRGRPCRRACPSA